MNRRENKGLVLLMVVVSMILLVIAEESAADCDEIYIKAGAGYKFDEQKEIRLQRDNGKVYEIANSPYSARFEGGFECGNLTMGVAHHSQWATGAPFNDAGEYYKTEFFIDYKFSWGI